MVPGTNQDVPTSMLLHMLFLYPAKLFPVVCAWLTRTYPPPLLGLLQEALCDLFCLPCLGEQSPFLRLHISQCITLTARVANSAHTVITTASERRAAGQGGLVKGGKQDSLPFCRLLSSALPPTYRLPPASLLYYRHLGAKGGNCTSLTIQHLIWLN